jgi:hypothetical protein
MKKLVFVSALLVFCSAFFSFSGNRGGDMFAIYLNGKEVHQQFVHADQSVKTLSLLSTNEKDRIEVLYSHCGKGGKGRVLTIRNGKNEMVKKLSYGDATDHRSLMKFYRKEIAGSKNASMSLSYSSSEIPEGKLLARIVWQEARPVVKL